MTNKLILKLLTALGAVLLAVAAPSESAAQGISPVRTADSMADFCRKGQAEYPGGIARMHPSFKFNICWWLEDAGIEASTFDEIVATPVSYTHLTLPTSDLV